MVVIVMNSRSNWKATLSTRTLKSWHGMLRQAYLLARTDSRHLPGSQVDLRVAEYAAKSIFQCRNLMSTDRECPRVAEAMSDLAWNMPELSLISEKTRPPMLRWRCTHPHKVTVWPRCSSVRAPQKAVLAGHSRLETACFEAWPERDSGCV